MTAKLSKYFLLLVLSPAVFGCVQKTVLNQEEYLRVVSADREELSRREIFNTVRYTTRLLPLELMTLTRHGKKFDTQAEFESEKRACEDQINFSLIIEDNEKSGSAVKRIVFDPRDYSKLMAYSNTNLQDDFSLVLEDGIIIPCAMVHLESANSVHPVIRISVSFTNVSPEAKAYTLIFNDNFFNNGRLKFSYEKEALKNLPQLKI